MPLTYFDLWIARLLGLLPELGTCIVCSDPLNGRAFFHAFADGLTCPEHKRLASSEMSSASRALAAQIFRSPIDAFTTVPWPRAVGADLRKFVAQIIERHIERKLVTNTALSRLD